MQATTPAVPLLSHAAFHFAFSFSARTFGCPPPSTRIFFAPRSGRRAVMHCSIQYEQGDNAPAAGGICRRCIIIMVRSAPDPHPLPPRWLQTNLAKIGTLAHTFTHCTCLHSFWELWRRVGAVPQRIAGAQSALAAAAQRDQHCDKMKVQAPDGVKVRPAGGMQHAGDGGVTAGARPGAAACPHHSVTVSCIWLRGHPGDCRRLRAAVGERRHGGRRQAAVGRRVLHARS